MTAGRRDNAATGRRGEDAAVDYLRRNGFLICARNWRSGRYEIDIVARKSGVTHMVEVKTRSAGSLLPPEAAVTAAKAAAMRRAAEAYAACDRAAAELQIDLVAVDMFPDGRYDIRYVPNVAEASW